MVQEAVALPVDFILRERSVRSPKTKLHSHVARSGPLRIGIQANQHQLFEIRDSDLVDRLRYRTPGDTRRRGKRHVDLGRREPRIVAISALALLERADRPPAVAVIERGRLEQPGEQPSPKGGPRGVERVGDEKGAGLGRHEWKVHRLEQPRFAGAVGNEVVGLAGRTPGRPAGRKEAGRQPVRGRESRWDLRIAVNPNDLLDQIFFDRDVRAPGRYTNLELRSGRLDCKSEAGEDADRAIEREVREPGEREEPGMPKTDRPGDERSRVFVDCSPAQLAPGGFEDEAGGEREPLRDRLDVGAPLVAVRGVGVEPVPSRGAPYRDRIPPRRLEEDILRRAGRNRRLDAADDSRERESPFFVGDDDIFGMKLPLDTIEAEEPLPFSRVADDQVAPRNFV